MDSLNSKLGTNPGILQGVWVVGISGAPHFLITSQSDQKNNTLVRAPNKHRHSTALSLLCNVTGGLDVSIQYMCDR